MTTTSKTNKVLGIFLIAFLSIVLRVWHLAVIQREEKLIEAQKPQKRSILLRADRGTICDRFNIPMALNKISYNAAIYYSQITQIPTITWKKSPEGKQLKVYARKEYVKNLATTLAKTLDLDPVRVEDLIHSKAALFPHVPFIIKTNLTEQEHYRLKMLEKDFVGIHAEIASKRHYPLGKIGCGIIGTMGAISANEYLSIAQEIKELETLTVPSEQDQIRLAELKEKAYGINDLIGKTGIEAQFEEELRGFFGKKIFEVDQKGKFLKELSERKQVPGRQVVLSISSELQEFAEQLLANDESTRDGRSACYDRTLKVKKKQKQPWIKGGAIVALDPKTGEILAMASYPRFDPNDFISSNKEVNRWLENENLIGSIWDGHEVLIRERGLSLLEEKQPLSWDFYLQSILPEEGPLRDFLKRVNNVKGAIEIQESYEALSYFTKRNLPVPEDVQSRVDATNLSADDLVFAADLFRTVIYAPAFSDELIEEIGEMPLSQYMSLCQAFQKHEGKVKKIAEEEFRKNEFSFWRSEHQKEFLSERRKSEKERKSYAKPYIDYLDKKEKELFSLYWEEKRIPLLVTEAFNEDLIRTFRSFSDLKRPLLGKYRRLRNYKKGQTEKDLAAAFYPREGFGFSRSFAFQSAAPQASIFKLVTAYEGLRQGKDLVIIDEFSKNGVAYNLNKVPYPRVYKGGRIPRSAAMRIGKIDLQTAIERTSNPYFSILAGDCFNDPEDLADAARLLGFGQTSGLELPRENKGKVPTDLKTNRTGLYATAIGQHTLLTTPIQTALMLSTLANGGQLLKPKIVKSTIGLTPDRHPLGPFVGTTYLVKNELSSMGIHFPLFTAAQMCNPLTAHFECTTEVRNQIPMTTQIRKTLLDAMDRVVWSPKGSSRPTAIKGLLRNQAVKKGFLSLKHQMVGKTGTAEIVCNLSANPSNPSELYKYIWYGAISFNDLIHEDPELVVVVFLRFGDYGKEAAPLATQMIHKWREIKLKHEKKEPFQSRQL